MNKKEIIGSSSLFEGLPEQQIIDIADIAVLKTYQRGENIFFEGDEGDGFYMVGEGRVKIFKVSLSGKEHILHFTLFVSLIFLVTRRPFCSVRLTLRCGSLGGSLTWRCFPYWPFLLREIRTGHLIFMFQGTLSLTLQPFLVEVCTFL